VKTWQLWDQCEPIINIIVDIYYVWVFQKPIYLVFDLSLMQLMLFVRLPKLIEMAERIILEQIVYSANTLGMQSINTSFLQQIYVNIHIVWVGM